MKRYLFILCTVLIAVPVLSQENQDKVKNMAITTNFVPLYVGTSLGGFGANLGYEFAPISQFSTKLTLQYIGFDPLNFYGTSMTLDDDDEGGQIDGRANISLVRVNAEGRWYWDQKYVQGVFLTGGLQYHLLSASVNLNLDDDDIREGGVYNSLGLGIGGGYKALFGRGRAAFALEPSLEYFFVLHSDIQGIRSMEGAILGWLLGIRGFRFNVLFGVAF